MNSDSHSPSSKPGHRDGALARAEAAARLAESALERTIAQIRTPEEAARVLAELERAAAGLREAEVGEAVRKRASARQGAAIRHAKSGALPGERPAAVIAETAAQIAAAPAETKRALDDAVAEAAGTGGALPPPPEVRRGRRLLRKALMQRMRPLDALDASVFLEINTMPHPAMLDRFMTRFSFAMTGGAGWALVLAAGVVADRQRGWQAVRGVVPALLLATNTVEFPIKRFFRRHRPFLSLVHAIVVGRKPGSYSFPSGHSAAAFAGAALLERYYPRGAKLWFSIASLVGFSRIYLGAHYPGDVLSGAIGGVSLARLFHRILNGKGAGFREPAAGRRTGNTHCPRR